LNLEIHRSGDRIMSYRGCLGQTADFLSDQRRATDFVETAAGRTANNSLHDARARLKISSQ